MLNYALINDSLQFIDSINMLIEKEIRDFIRAYDIKLIMSHRSFTISKLFSYIEIVNPYCIHQVLCFSCRVVVVKIILGKPNVTSLLASKNIERVKILKFANFCQIILTTKLPQ